MKVWPLLLVDGTLLVVILRVDSQVDAKEHQGFAVASFVEPCHYCRSHT